MPSSNHPEASRPEQKKFEAVGAKEELKKILRDCRLQYERQISWHFVTVANEDVEAIWKELLRLDEIEAHGTWSGGIQSLEFLEQIDKDQRR